MWRFVYVSIRLFCHFAIISNVFWSEYLESVGNCCVLFFYFLSVQIFFPSFRLLFFPVFDAPYQIERCGAFIPFCTSCKSYAANLEEITGMMKMIALSAHHPSCLKKWLVVSRFDWHFVFLFDSTLRWWTYPWRSSNFRWTGGEGRSQVFSIIKSW